MYNPTKKLQRSSQILSILAKYGFKDAIARLPWKGPRASLERNIDVDEIGVYTRIRMALEELGPAFIKLGQSASTREGLLPKDLVEELKRLEDNVPPFEVNIREYLAEELGLDTTEQFQAIDADPFAAASIAQVYRATLKDGTKVVLKVRRPGIDEVMRVDLALMRDIAKILTMYNDALENLNLSLIVESFAMTLQEEMSLVIERHNIERFAKNFKGNKLIKVPRVYPDLSTDRVLCMEYLEGFKVTDVAEIKRRGMDVETLVKNGINLYLEQVIIHGFFHGDPHPGNMMVMPDGRIAFLDFGNMGKLLGIDRRQLEEFIQSAISEDAVRLADVIEDVAVVSHIPDRNQFERSLYEIFDMIDNVSLGDLSLDLLFNKLWKIIGDNRLYFPEYIYQLMRGISLMEGIGRQLYPDLNIMESIKPFARRIMMERLSPEAIFKKGKHKVESFARDVEKLPEDMRALVRLFRTGNFTLNHRLISARSFNAILRKGVNRIVIGIMFMSLNLLGGMVIVARIEPQWLGIPVFAWICLGSAWVFAVYLFIAMIRAKDND